MPYNSNLSCDTGGWCFDLINETSGGGGIHAYTSGAGWGVSGSTWTGYGVYGSATSGYAVYGTTSSTTGGTGVYGQSAASNNTGPGVHGFTTSTSQGVGVKGEAPNGSTAIWGKNPGGVAAWMDGNVYVGSGGLYYSTGSQTAIEHYSDLRLKKNVKPLEGALDQLLRLRGVTYEWKEPAEHGNEHGPIRGFIAQEVEKVFPEWVGESKGYKTLNTSGLEAVLVESLRTLKSENDALRAQSSKLEDRIKALEAGRVSRADVTGGNSGTVAIIAIVAGAALVFSRRRRPESDVRS
jgi:hypothetical protein